MATKRLIDVCAEIRKIEEVLAERKEQAGSLTYKVFEAVKTALEKAPTVDAVEVVRCKDCKHWRWSKNNMFGEDYGTCVECLMDTNKDHFCSYGERKDNED